MYIVYIYMGNNYIPGKHRPSSTPVGLVVSPKLYCIVQYYIKRVPSVIERGQ